MSAPDLDYDELLRLVHEESRLTAEQVKQTVSRMVENRVDEENASEEYSPEESFPSEFHA